MKWISVIQDGRIASEPHRAVPRFATEGDWVGETLEGSLCRVAAAEAPEAQLYQLMASQGISLRRDPGACKEALAAQPALSNELEDMRSLPFITMDNPDSQDLDQALCVERDGTGWRVWYAIADAAATVPLGSRLFAECLQRGASVYLPNAVVPMLPSRLSENIISLNPQVERPALVFDVRVDGSGAVSSSRLTRSKIRSRLKLSYEGVQRWLDGTGPLLSKDGAVNDSLDCFAEFGEARAGWVQRQGVVTYRRNETHVQHQGGQWRFVHAPRFGVESWNANLSVMCNILGAEALAADHRPFVSPVYRTHPEPPTGSGDALRRLTHGVAEACQQRRYAWSPDESLATYLDRLPSDETSRAIHRQAVFLNVAGAYTAEPGLHYGLGVTPYGRFTAPMREVVGVWSHQELWQSLGRSPVGEVASSRQYRERVIQAAQASRQQQSRLNRSLTRLALDDWLSGRQRFTGTLLGIGDGRLYVRSSQGAELKLYRRHQQAPYEVLSSGAAIRIHDRKIVLGSKVDVAVEGLDGERWQLAIVP